MRLRQRPRRNRLGANSLLDTIVFGERSGNHAAMSARDTEYVKFNVEAVVNLEQQRIQEMLDRPQNGDRVASIRLALGQSMNQNLAVFRDQAGIEETLHDLPELKAQYAKVPVDDKGRVFNTDLVFALELGFMLDCAETVAVSALERQDSRGAQFRTDFPARDDENWLKHIVATKGELGPHVSYLPVTITKWPPEERKY